MSTYMTAELCQSRNATHGSNHASCHFGKADDGPSACDDHIAVEDCFGTTAHADTVDCCNDGFGTSACAHAAKTATFEPLKGLIDLGIGLHGLSSSVPHGFGSLILVEPVLEVLSSTKSSSFTGKNDDPQRRFGLEPVEDTADVLLHGICHGVELLRPVESHLEDMASRDCQNEMGAHLGNH